MLSFSFYGSIDFLSTEEDGGRRRCPKRLKTREWGITVFGQRTNLTIYNWLSHKSKEDALKQKHSSEILNELSLFNNTIMSAKRGRGRPKSCSAQRRDGLRNKQQSMSCNDLNCKQVEEEPADPETREICHVTKFGNWEFEGLKAFVKGEDWATLNWTLWGDATSRGSGKQHK